MFRKINIKTEGENFKAELYRNRHEKIGDIPNDYIGTVKRSLEDIDEFDVTIPKYVGAKGTKKINPLYMKIKPMQHIIVTTTVDGIKNKERFILIEPKGNRNKNTGEKSFKAISFEHTLKKKRTSFENKVIQLKKGDVHIAEGILDKFARETGWGIGYVDPKSRVELMSTTEKVNVDLFKNYSKTTNVTEGGLLFEKEIITTIADSRPLYISFEYSNFKTYDGEKLLIETPSIYNTITDALHMNIKKVQAYHYSDVGNRYGIRYVFTLTDNTTVERISVFTNIINKTFSCENIRLVWETGNIVETENVKYINIESLDTDWYETLRSLQDNFKSVFLYDGYNKTVSVIHRDNLGEEKPYVLTYDNAIIDIDVTENSDYVTGLKVMGKNGLSIVSENIYGDDIVRNYSEYIRLGNMSEELQLALERYETILTTKQQEWLGIKDSVITETQKKVRIDSEIQSLQTRIKELKNLLAGYMTEKDTSNQARIKAEIDGLETRLNECLSLRLSYNTTIESLNDELSAISKSIDREVVVDSSGKIFTDDDLQELNDIEQFNYYEDDYYSNSFSLLNASKKVLEDMIKPQVDFDINCVDLCKSIANKKGWNYILQLGSLFKFNEEELKEEIGDDTIRLVSYEYVPKTDTINKLTFTNKIYKYNVIRQIADLNKKTNTNNNILSSLRPIIDDAMLSNNFVGEVLKNGLDMSAYVAKSRSTSNYLDISSAGIFISDQSDLNKSLYIGSGLIAISNDGFRTSELALNADGLMGNIIIGELLIGSKLIISSEDGSFVVGNTDENEGFGLVIRDGGSLAGQKRIFLGTEMVGGVRKAVLKLIGKNGQLALSEDGILNTGLLTCGEVDLDSLHPIVADCYVDESVNRIERATLIINCKRFRSTTKGSKLISKTSTVSSGGGSTSGASSNPSTNTNGTHGHSSMLVVEQPFTPDSNYKWAKLKVNTGSSGGYVDGSGYIAVMYDGNILGNYITTYASNGEHTHDNYHTHQTPDHIHPNIDISHQHEEIWGINEDTVASNVNLYVNDVLVARGINGRKEIDIKDYLVKGDNQIKLESFTNGRISWNCSMKSFNLF